MEMEMEKGGDASSPDPTTIIVHLKFSGRTLPLSVSPDSTVRELKTLIQPLTNVLPRGQKLIFKGKVLADDSSLRVQQLTNGSKLMLIASQGLHQGDGPITKDAITSPSTNTRAKLYGKDSQIHKSQTVIIKSRSERWRSTGVVALSESNLKAVPEEVWACGSSIRVLDISTNSIQDIPIKISALKSLNKLILNANGLLDENISWEGLSSLKVLTLLSLNQNRITSLPSSIGNCRSLIEIDLSCNLLAELPETLGDICNLKALHLRNNGIKFLPSTLFKMCSQLSTLDLHGTEITNDGLRQIEGWEDFDNRRRLKHQKQLDFRVGSSGVFDEGADDNRGS
ncbi:plant intracellular Ras-group-related LRR protein 8 isoform X2 [Ananas comosus]|uniref:Plant intracellular Ras-group-related LRR protein 8 isoform X2 n=1 Tax=Ananas comosus TaxID=4615 RepID=A0A6P5EXX6_ANACO|nr:plant intracellular Ras-group-related LRR protein 8 isoform X2 [Ananas comosus]